MGFLNESSDDSWEPSITADTATFGYWFNWRVLLCALWALIIIPLASFLIWKYEDFCNSKRRNGGTEEQEKAWTLNDDETWSPCFKGVHPAWLLGFRAIAFCLLFTMLVITVLLDGPSIYYYYTQWTFTLITIYFGLGLMLSVRGCCKHQYRAGGDKVINVEVDPEQGIPVSSFPNENPSMPSAVKSSNHQRDDGAGFWAYAFQIIFQINGGAVVLTDCVFWFIIFPFLMIKNYKLSLLDINMHTINVVLLLGDMALNSLRFPLFRIGYFFLWTIVFVTFQWILHACVEFWWPYPFLDLSSRYAPLWYLCGTDALPMLRNLRFGGEAEALLVAEMVPAVLSILCASCKLITSSNLKGEDEEIFDFTTQLFDF